MSVLDGCKAPGGLTHLLLLAMPLAPAVALQGCGAGLATVVSVAGGSGGSNALPAMSAFLVASPKTPACEVRFVLSDAEGDPATVEFLYQVPGQPVPRPMTHLIGLPSNPATLATTSQGVGYCIPWNFPEEDLLPADASFTDGVLVMARVRGAPDVIVLGANAQRLGLGNDPPEILSITPLRSDGDPFHDPPELDEEATGNVEIVLGLRDSSADNVRVEVDWRRSSDGPEDWTSATVGGLPESLGTIAAEMGQTFSFFWRTGEDGLGSADDEFLLRVTADDGTLMDEMSVGVGSATSAAFRVDNNAAPIVQLGEGAFISNPDSARGIHVPFVAIDEEGDEITVVLQWRREAEDFPSLSGTAAEIEAILSDEGARREKHVCSQYPRTHEGRVVPIDATHVRLPELSGALSFLVAEGLVGRPLEILRPPTGVVRVSDAWPLNPLLHPVAALPLDGGTHALVLDGSSGGNWALFRIRLTDGQLDGSIASGTGVPSAMCFTRDGTSVLVASSLGSAWQLIRVEPASGRTTLLADASAGPVEQGVVRGIASLGEVRDGEGDDEGAAVLTVGSSIVQVDWSTPGVPRAHVVRNDLETPWGIVPDPRNAGRVLVAESSGPGALAPGRVVTVDLATGTLRPVVIRPSVQDGLAFPRPRGIALQRKGTRLVAVCEADPVAGEIQLRSVDLGRADTSSAAPIGPQLGAGTAALAAGSEDDLLIATSGLERLVLVAGGVERRASIQAVDPGTAVVSVNGSDFTPVPGSRWRLELLDDGPLRVASSAQGLAHSFLWNSMDLPGGGNVYLRATPLDTDLGTSASSTGSKAVSPKFDPAPQVVTSGGRPRAFAFGDLDGDGDLDLVSAKNVSNELRLLWQTTPGVFELDPNPLGGPGITDHPASVLTADLDGDGDLDLVSGNQLSNTVTIFLQDASGGFGPPTELSVLGPPGPVAFPRFVVQAADLLDGDGDLDLVCANFGSSNLVLFRQTAPGVFELVDPNPLGGPGMTPEVTYVQAADLDADGDLDLVSANSGNGTLTLFWQRQGVFVPYVLSVTSLRPGPLSVQAGDLDGDGDLDLVSANGASHDLSLFWQTAPGRFEKDPTPLGAPLLTSGATYVQLADLDEDGDLDVVCGNLQFSTVTVFWQTAPGVFDPIPTVVGGQGLTFGIEIGLADLDGDGDLDLVSANPGTSDNLSLFWQTAPGDFDPEMYTLRSIDLGKPLDVQPADLDGDGDLDLVSANAFDGPNNTGDDLTVFWQAGQGTLQPAPTRLGGPGSTRGPRSVQAADLDGDGHLDVVSANFDGNDLAVFWQDQDAPGTFEPAFTVVGGPPSTLGPACIQAIDLDGDGDLDLVSANQLGNDLAVFKNTGPRTFQSDPILLGGSASISGPRFVQAGDLDGDGDLDLVSANHDGNDLSVFWQIAPLTFEATPTRVGGLPAMEGPTCVRAVDLDADGDLDLVCANEGGDNLTVFWQIAPRCFDPVPVTLGDVSTTLDPPSVQACDLDGDGDLDLVTLNRQPAPIPSTLTVFWQTTPGHYTPVPTRIDVPGPTGSGGGAVNPLPASVHAVDFDADGDPDLVFASTNLHYLAVCRKLH